MKKITSYTAIALLAAAASSFVTITLIHRAPSNFIAIKSTEASRALDEAAKDLTSKDASIKDDADQAKAKLDADQKDNLAQAQILQKELSDLLKADPKYKSYVDRMDEIQKKASDIQRAAQTDFDAKHKDIQKAMEADSNTIKSLYPIVRQENHLPATSSYEISTQTWHASTPKSGPMATETPSK